MLVVVANQQIGHIVMVTITVCKSGDVSGPLSAVVDSGLVLYC